MLLEIEKIRKEINDFNVSTEEELESFRKKYVGRKSVINQLFENFKELPGEQKREIGKPLNILKEEAQNIFKQYVEDINNKKEKQKSDVPDMTLPNIPNTLGSRHPVSIIKERMIAIFARIGFNVEEGPEIEEDWYNFTALNFPENHPAREMQDTFFIENDPDIVLRTHTSNVQIRLMEKTKPPIRSIMPGRVYRNEAISARAHCFFHQIEGLYINKNVGFKDLKDTIYYFARELFGNNTKIRFRPSYFPFTEPSAEIDISCGLNEPGECKLCGGTKNICKGTGWVEIGGSGMVDPNVLENCKIDPDIYTGFAFGMGVERIAMLKYQIKDIRLFTENDIRFLRQFIGA